MNEAHCLVCLEQGPDLVIRREDLDGALEDGPLHGLVADIEFTCGNCGRRWSWRARFVDGAWRYVVVMPAPTRPGFGAAN